jgi:AAA15 family ATPase/GTPase
LFREIIQKSSLDKETEVFSDPETVHRTYDDNQRFQGTVKFSMEKHESHGTQKFFYLTGPILDAMENGYILVVDELDANIHPNLVKKIISLFNSQKTNPHNAQLIFNTHNTNLLNDPTVRRDQVWFVEKDRYGAAKLYSLAEFKSSVRKEEQFEKNYIRGKYGAIPVLNDLYPGYGNKVSDNNEDAQ